MRIRWLAGGLSLFLALATPAQQELVIPRATPTIDGDLSEWANNAAIRIGESSQVLEGKDAWGGAADVSGDFRVAFDTNHLYLAGTIRDDQIVDDQNLVAKDRSDRIELFLRSGESGGALQPEEIQLQLQPLNKHRPWSWTEGSKGGARQGGASLTGVRVAARRIDAQSYQFEASVPFHHLTGLRPGCQTLGFGLVVHDHDGSEGQKRVVVSWTGLDPASAKGLGVLRLPSPGPMVSLDEGTGLLTEELLEDLPYVLVPLLMVVLLFFMLRGWARVRARTLWLRPTLIGVGVLLFGLGLWLPTLLTDLRMARQRERLDQALTTLQESLGWLEQGTLASYRGAKRDLAVMDLLANKPIARQRYTSYRTLAQLAPEQFGPGPRQFDDLPVRPYWIPLPTDRAESFQFDPPLRGSQLHLVIGRPFEPAFTFPVREDTPRLRIELDFGVGDKRTREIDVDRFDDAVSLGREYAQACVVPVPLDRDLRSLSVAAVRGSDLRLVGVSLQGAVPGLIEPLLLGTPTLGGVLTDLRGAYPQDAGIELAGNATARVEIPATEEPPQKLWFIYRAVYPGMATVNPGVRVAEIVLHFRGGAPPRSIVLEHQVSMFYELAFHNTRDDPPEGSPAAIALSWIDDSLEKHVNLVYPVLDLPQGSELEAIEFRNLAEYRMRFRSVVLGNERAAAPQDPVDAPLVREGQEIRLPRDVLDELDDVATLIYRGGRLSETTMPQEQRQDVAALPRTLSGPGVTATEAVLQDGGRRVTLFAPLSGDGWDGAVLGVASTDAAWTASRESSSLIGLVLCLISTPLLLVLLSELLAAATNLRFRLMAVLSVASLAPLGLLSFVLVQVLEGGHASDVQEGMRGTVRRAIGQLDDQKEKVRASAAQWLHDLTTLATGKLDKVQEAQFAKDAPPIRAELQKLMAGQLPPEWGAGFLRLEWQPVLGGTTMPPEVVLAGDARMANVETPARLEPGVFLQWGVLMIGVRVEETVRGGTFRLTVGRPIDGNLLGTLAPGQVVLLTDARGYPLAASTGKPEAALLFDQALDPTVMGRRERALQRGLEERQPVVERSGSRAGDFVYGSEVLRDLQDTPRGLLVVGQPDQRATLELAIGRIPVRAFFLLVAGMLVVLAAFLSFVVSSRISRPIERLEHGALALSRGALDTRVVVDEGGQIGRLTRTFNQMAADLQGRLQDLQSLNRAMRDLSAEADEETTLGVLRTFCAAHTAADSVRIVLADQAQDRLVVHPGNDSPANALPSGAGLLARILGPFSIGSRGRPLQAPWAEVLQGSRSAVCLPIVFSGRTRGIVLLGCERDEPMPVDVELLSTVVSQAAVALERAQLRRLAVQDPVTGVFTPEYFRRRTVDEVSVAQQRGRPLTLLGTALGDGDRRPRGLRRFIGILREKLPPEAVLCHEGAGRMLAVLPGVGRAAVQPLLEAVFSAWRELVAQLPENEVEERPPVGVIVQFPDEASSTELLFDALRERLSALHTPGASAMESDESLQRAGVTTISPSMREVYRTLRAVAPTDLPILLEGETGVGKEILTNLVHSWSRRAGGPLVKVHCAALTETLLASELFGHEKGAFTGADRRKIGRFEQADSGTLFLDEVGDIPLDVQVKLLRVLQEHEVDRVGGTVPVKVDVRVIAATNRDIARMVAEGKFREDLYYRLQGMVVRVPPLRERKQEISGLVEHFRREVVAAGQSHTRTFSTDAMDELYRREWPGNIRELRNTVYRAMVFARGDVVHHRDVLAALAGSGAAMGGERAPLDRAELAPPVARAAGREEPAVERGPSTAPPPALPPSPIPESAVPPEVEFVVPQPPRPGGQVSDPSQLPERLKALHALIVAQGSLKTEGHMKAASVSHRTGLRDLQYLVKIGLIERVGTRRGAFYRPTSPDSRRGQ